MAARLGALALCCILALAGAEVGLRVAGERVVMPPEWRQRETDGGVFWHGHFHALGPQGFRRVDAFPPRRPGVHRVAVIGDSMTYGYGVAVEDAYPAVLERALGLEVLNLGISGDQAADHVETLRRWLPELGPDLLVYGVCVNDFVPPAERGPRQLSPFARAVFERTAVGALVGDHARGLLIAAGLAPDFDEHILRDFDHRREVFLSHVREMRRLALEHTERRPLALVVDNRAHLKPRRLGLVESAERALAEAGFVVVPSASYRSRMRGAYVVSRWEGHPNAEAHRMFAAALEPAIRDAVDGRE